MRRQTIGDFGKRRYWYSYNRLAFLKDIANEERVHVGEFLRLLRELAPDEEKFYAEGAEEVEKVIRKMK